MLPAGLIVPPSDREVRYWFAVKGGAGRSRTTADGNLRRTVAAGVLRVNVSPVAKLSVP